MLDPSAWANLKKVRAELDRAKPARVASRGLPDMSSIGGFLSTNATGGTSTGVECLLNPFFVFSPPQLTNRAGYHLTVTTRDSCSLPFAESARATPLLLPPRHSGRPASTAGPAQPPKNPDDLTWWRGKKKKKEVKKPQASSRQDVGTARRGGRGMPQ